MAELYNATTYDGQSPLSKFSLSLTVTAYYQNQSEDDATQDTKNVPAYVPWDNPHNVISFRTYTLIQNVMYYYISPLVFCIGVPTNVINCIVFVRQGVRDRMNLCLFCLSIVDLLFVVLFGMYGLLYWLDWLMPAVNISWLRWTIHKNVLGMTWGFLLSSGCLTMIISVERCVCVFLPLRASSLMRTRTMAFLIVGTLVFIQLLCAIHPFKLKVVPVTNPLTNLTDHRLAPTAFYFRNSLVFDILQNTIVTTLFPSFIVVVVFIATTITVVQLKRMIAWREEQANGRRLTTTTTTKPTTTIATLQQITLIKMLVVVSNVFILTSSPIVALTITGFVEPEFFVSGRYSIIFRTTHVVHVHVALVNSSVNFFIYVARSSRFRQELAAFAACRGLRGWMKKELTDTAGII